MKLFNLRKGASEKGFVIFEILGEGFLLTNLSSKNLIEIKYSTLKELEEENSIMMKVP